jgi:hypothetical protein
MAAWQRGQVITRLYRVVWVNFSKIIDKKRLEKPKLV